MKITRLIQLGLVTSTTFTAAAALTSCSSKEGEFSPIGSGAATHAGTAGNRVGAAGASSATGGTSAALGGSSATSGGVRNGAGTTGAGGAATGGAAGSDCTNLPPNNGDTCEHALEYGWCEQDWLGESCRKSCGKCSAGHAGTGSGGGSGPGLGGGGQPPVLEGGSPGWASRYWDCCKPACGWKGNVPGGSTPVSSCSAQDQSLGGNYDAKNACEGGGSAYMCHDFGPWAVSDTLAYGYAAVSMGNDYCGKCFQLQFTGSSHTANNDPGAQALAGKTMIVQAINNGGVGSNQFDILIPGGGVGDFDACSSQWGTSDLGERYGGFYLACQKQHGFNHGQAKACAAAKCQSVFAGKPSLLAGCNFFVDWYGAPDNPNLVFKEVACPEALTQQSGLKR